MTLIDSTPRALESTVPTAPDVRYLMPDARQLAEETGEIPSIRRLMRVLRTGHPRAGEIQRRLIAENPMAPVSGGAPEWNALSEPTAPYAVLPAVLPTPPPARTAPEAPTRSRRTQTLALIVPLLLVNSAALYGQAGWAYDHLGHSRPVAVLFAAAVESIGVYLAAEAHGALMAGDASARLRLGSYLIGLLVGVLNFAHFAGPGYAPNPVALTFGLLSSISPWLWAIRSRSMNRDRLRELGQIDPRAVRFSLLRWALFPLRTGRAFRGAVWAGEVQPAEAVAAADQKRDQRREQRIEDRGTRRLGALMDRIEADEK